MAVDRVWGFLEGRLLSGAARIGIVVCRTILEPPIDGTAPMCFLNHLLDFP